MKINLIGIDFGAKLAGTTAVCFARGQQLHLLQSTKKQDADAWLCQRIEELQPSSVYMDAPLSLPGVYSGVGSDYHFRASDRAVGAMSPMFLGGLTARAMQLRAAFPSVPFYEVYPAQMVRLLQALKEFYKKDLPLFLKAMQGILPFPFDELPQNWHQADAALAWFAGWRHQHGEAESYGDAAEGQIWA